MTRTDAERAAILRVVVGSGVHGIAQDGTDDRDEMGVVLEPYPLAMGLNAPFEQFIHRDAAVREGRPDAPSQPGDLDLTLFSLRKWVRLALNGNPTVLLLLFSPQIVSVDARGLRLRELAPRFASRRAGRAFLGYMQAQRQRLTGERGQKNVNRRDLVARHGYDTKYAGHLIRLGMQGNEYIRTGRITLPMSDTERDVVVGVRQGRYSEQDVLTMAGELEATLRDEIGTSPLPEEPDTATVEDWMLGVYFESWKATYDHARALAFAQAIPHKPATRGVS